MSENRWIIATHKFVEHTTIGGMQAELARLQAKYPEKNFRVYRVKALLPTLIQVGDHSEAV